MAGPQSDFRLWGVWVKAQASTITAALVLAVLCFVQVSFGQNLSAQDRPLGDVAWETRAQIAQSKPAKTLTSDGPDAAITAGDDPLQVITKAAEAMVRDNSHRCRQVSFGNSGPGWREVATKEFGDDRMRFVAEQGARQGEETIFIGKDGYRKTASGPWARVEPGEMSWYQTWTRPAMLKLPDELKFGYKPGDVKLIGPEMIASVSTFHYKVKVESFAIDRTIDIWVGASDGLPRKTEMMTYDLQTKTSWHTTTECTYGVEIKIEAPM